MTTLIIQHDDCLRHDTGPHHAERPERVSAVLNAIEGLPGLEFLPAPLADDAQVTRVHEPAYLQRVRDTEPASGRASIDEQDNVMSQGSVQAALRASGGICFAIDQVLAGQGDNAFCATRPPGHHAERGRAMGFCLFNHVAVGARHALAEHGITRVAILDFDVHHGNGTQAIFHKDPSVMFVSSHQVPLYPGSGMAEDTGRGNVLNLPLRPATGSAEFRDAWSAVGLPAVRAFRPELILVSAGFDGHWRDPLAQLELTGEDYHWITAAICETAGQCCDGKVVSILEGGYHLDALGESARLHVEVLASGR